MVAACGVVVHEKLEQLGGQEASRGRVAHQRGQDIVGVQVAGLAEKRLVVRVVLGGVERELTGAVERVAGERARSFLHVLLGVVADADCEQLLHFAGVVLVGPALAVLVVVEPDEHGRVAGHGLQQGFEIAQRVVAEQLDLLQHQDGAAHFAGGGGEVGVPEEDHFLLERSPRVQHAHEPGEARALDIASVDSRQGGKELFGRRIVDLLVVE